MTEKPNEAPHVPPLPIILHRQYLKDLSFENPNAPDILRGSDNRPEMDLNIQLDLNRIEDEEFAPLYEVVLHLKTSAMRDGKAMFLAEISYGATISFQELEENKHHPYLLIEVPNLIFPFARQHLANITQAGGFMPLQLRPVDFRAMYMQRFGKPESGKAA